MLNKINTSLLAFVVLSSTTLYGTSIVQSFESNAAFVDNFTESTNNSGTPFSWSTTNGINNSGKILIASSSDQIWTTKQKYSMVDNGVYTLGALYHSQYNSGYGSFGFTIASQSDASGERGAPAENHIGMSFHAGGGNWLNDSYVNPALTWDTALDIDISNAEWYYFELQITDTTNGNFDLVFTIYDVDQTTGAITGTKSTRSKTITNANVKSASDLYVFFGADGQRMIGFDEFKIDVSANVVVTGTQTGQVSNALPTLTSTDVLSVDEDSLYTYDLTSSDADNDTVSITATTKPAWLSISSINAPANYIVAPNFTIDAGLDITNYTVDIGQNFVAGDSLSFDTAVAVSNGGITGNFNASSGTLTFTGTATRAQWQTILRTVKITLAASTAIRVVDFNKEGLVSLDISGTKHFYEVIANGSPIDWTPAKNAAAALTKLGRQGYLATITSAAENNFLAQKVVNNTWIGASDAASEGDWKWVTGPEAGTSFWSGTGAGSAVGGAYNNWQAGEPNNAGNENVAHMFAAGDWNDLADTNPGVSYYIVEYGGMGGDVTTEIITQSFSVERVFRLSGTPTGSDVGANNVTLSLDDGNGGVTPYSFVINVANTNDVPTSADFTVNMNEDTTKTFASSDFPYTDSADDITAGDSLYSVIITSLPASGSLKASGVDVVLNQEVTPVSNLTFTPVANEFGAPYTTFDFKINDGDANSSLAYTVDINVTDVAEPVATPTPTPTPKPPIFTDDDSTDNSFEIVSTTFNSGTVFNTIQDAGVKLQTRKDTSGVLHHSLSVDGKTTVAESSAPNTSVAFVKDKDGNAGVQTKASVETEDKKAVEIEVEALADGTAVHTMAIEKRVTKVTVELPGAKTIINEKGDILTSFKENPDECTEIYVDVEIQTLHDGLTKSLFKTYNCNNELIDTKETLIDEQRFPLGVAVEVKKDVNGIVIEVVTAVTQDIQF